MNFLRNTLGVLLGLAVAAAVISLGIRVNSAWVTYKGFLPFEHWNKFLHSVKGKDSFFLSLLFISGVAATIGGVVAAIVVKYAKVAYAMLIGFILLFIALLDIIIFENHPTFYKIGIFLTFFPFAWLGGKIVDVLFERRRKRKLIEKLNKDKN